MAVRAVVEEDEWEEEKEDEDDENLLRILTKAV